MHNSIVVYDLEIVKGILMKNEGPKPGIEYCAGWRDYADMGISVLGAYDYQEDRYRVFCQDNREDFFTLLSQRKIWVTFNGLSFDNKVIEANWDLGKAGEAMANLWPFSNEGHEASGEPPHNPNYDILVELWVAAGLGPVFKSGGHGGYGLDATCKANLGYGKTGNGALAPILWQEGKVGEVVDYCLSDVHRTKKLFDMIIGMIPLISPKTGNLLELRNPFIGKEAA